MKWIDRRFEPPPEPGLFRAILERLRGTPARVRARLHGHPPELLSLRPDVGWSVQTHLGHLLDLEPLWATRLDELLAGDAVLSAADMSNAATEAAGHDARDPVELAAEFGRVRGELLSRLEALDDDDALRVARHPRLDRPFRLVDLVAFIAEHDDHHLAAATALARAFPEPVLDLEAEGPRLNQVTVPAVDVAASLDFYRRLGAVPVVISPHYARFRVGAATLSVHVVEDLPAVPPTAVYLEIRDLDAFVERLIRAGLEFESTPRDEPWRWREARLRDPAGNPVVLYRAGAMRLFPPWRVRESGEA
ncbi:MAG: DinB family protein [Planctomycetota bacterium]